MGGPSSRKRLLLGPASANGWWIDQPARLPRAPGGVLLIACLVMTVNLLVDVLYGVFKPPIPEE